MPWDDLRYIFGEIMYGGHIVEDWDRRLAAAYLLKYFNEGLLEGMEMFPSFNTPANTLSHKQVCHGGPLSPTCRTRWQLRHQISMHSSQACAGDLAGAVFSTHTCTTDSAFHATLTVLPGAGGHG